MTPATVSRPLNVSSPSAGGRAVGLDPALNVFVYGAILAVGGGALWGAIVGVLKARTGAHEVITTIMLNWIAYWFGSYAFGQGAPVSARIQVNAGGSFGGDRVTRLAHLPLHLLKVDERRRDVAALRLIGCSR